MAITRIYTGADGLTHSEPLTLTPEPRRRYEEALRLGGADSRKAKSISFSRQSPGFASDWHTVDNPVFTITVSGHAEHDCSDGTVARVGPGDIMLFEDTAGKGHTTRIVGNEPRTYETVPVEEVYKRAPICEAGDRRLARALKNGPRLWISF